MHPFIRVDNLLDVVCSTSAVAILTSGEVIGRGPLEFTVSISKIALILDFQ